MQKKRGKRNIKYHRRRKGIMKRIIVFIIEFLIGLGVIIIGRAISDSFLCGAICGIIYAVIGDTIETALD